jgi:hypothetical protein
VGPRAGLGVVEERKILAYRESNTGRPAHSPSLYRLLFWNRVMDIYVGLSVCIPSHNVLTHAEQCFFTADLSEAYKQLRPEAEVSFLITIHPDFPKSEYLNCLLFIKT